MKLQGPIKAQTKLHSTRCIRGSLWVPAGLASCPRKPKQHTENEDKDGKFKKKKS